MALCVLRKHTLTLLTLIVLVTMAFVLLMFEVTPLAHTLTFHELKAQNVFPLSVFCVFIMLRYEPLVPLFPSTSMLIGGF